MTLVVMAAGIGSRFGGIKQIEPVGQNGEIIIDYSVYDAIKAGFNRIIFIIRKDIEEDFCNTFFNRLKDHIGDEVEVTYVFQQKPTWRNKPLGTTDAVLSAKHLLDEPFCVINADDFYGAGAFHNVVGIDKNTLVAYRLIDTISDFGSVTRGVISLDAENKIADITEVKEVVMSDIPTKYCPDTKVNVNFFMFNPDIIPHLENIHSGFIANLGQDQKAECLLPETLGKLIRDGRLELNLVETRGTWTGITYKEDKGRLENIIKDLTEKGTYPSPLWKR